MIKNSTPAVQEINNMELDQLLALFKKQDQVPSWPVLGQAILLIEQKGYPSKSKGIKHWLEALIEPLNIKRTAAWRYRAVAKDWPWLRQQMLNVKLSTPELIKLNPRVNPEQIEILVRLVKASSPDIWQPVAQQVLESKITLREIRRIWSHHRPILDGKTARKRGSAGFVASVTIDDQSPVIESARFKGKINQQLATHFPAILEHQIKDSVTKFCFYSDADEIASLGIHLDAVASVVLRRETLPFIHGFVITQEKLSNSHINSMYENLKYYVDVLWLVSTHQTQSPAEILIDDKGLIRMTTVRDKTDLLRPLTSLNTTLLRWLHSKGMQPLNVRKKTERIAALINQFEDHS